MGYLIERGDGVGGAYAYRVALCLEVVHCSFGCSADVSWRGVIVGDFVEDG